MRAAKCGIYSILCKPKAMMYVGQSRNIINRFTHHRFMLRKGVHANKSLQKDWNGLGEDAFLFEIEEECGTEDLDDWELWWINTFETYNAQHNDGDFSDRNAKIAAGHQRVRQTPQWKAAASERAKKQHAAGKLGRQTWKSG